MRGNCVRNISCMYLQVRRYWSLFKCGGQPICGDFHCNCFHGITNSDPNMPLSHRVTFECAWSGIWNNLICICHWEACRPCLQPRSSGASSKERRRVPEKLYHGFAAAAACSKATTQTLRISNSIQICVRRGCDPGSSPTPSPASSDAFPSPKHFATSAVAVRAGAALSR